MLFQQLILKDLGSKSLSTFSISTRHIPTLLAQHLQAPAKRSQYFNATDGNIVGRNMLHAFGHPVDTCCDMLRAENRNSAHAQAQHCCPNLTKRLQHHATTRHDRVAKRMQYVAPQYNVTLKCCDRLTGALRSANKQVAMAWLRPITNL